MCNPSWSGEKRKISIGESQVDSLRLLSSSFNLLSFAPDKCNNFPAQRLNFDPRIDRQRKFHYLSEFLQIFEPKLSHSKMQPQPRSTPTCQPITSPSSPPRSNSLTTWEFASNPIPSVRIPPPQSTRSLRSPCKPSARGGRCFSTVYF